MITMRCSRCGRTAPSEESVAFLGWEAADETGGLVVCPDCLTPDEETSMADDMTLIPYELEAQGYDVGDVPR